MSDEQESAQSAQEYEPQGSASIEDAPEEFQDNLEQVRLYLAQSGGNLAFVMAYQPDEGEPRLFTAPVSEDEATEWLVEALGPKTAKTIIQNAGMTEAALKKARDAGDSSVRGMKVIDGDVHVGIYTPRARAAFLAIHCQEVLEAPTCESVEDYFPKESSGFNRRTANDWKVINRLEAVEFLHEAGVIDDGAAYRATQAINKA